MLRPLAAAVLLLALAPEARAGDPLEEVSGTESWYRPRRSRHPVETQRTIRRRAELHQASRDFATDLERMRAEQEEFVADFLLLERHRRRRPTATAPARPSGPRPAPRPPRSGDWLAEEERRLEQAAERALRDRFAEPGLPVPVAAAADAAFGAAAAPLPGEGEAPEPDGRIEPGERAGRLEQARQARRAEALRREEAERRGRERRAAEQAEADRRRRDQQAAERLGGRLDGDGQFVDPDLEQP